MKDFKCTLTVAMTRLKVLKSKYGAKSQLSMKEIAELLTNGKYENARYRVSPFYGPFEFSKNGLFL